MRDLNSHSICSLAGSFSTPAYFDLDFERSCGLIHSLLLNHVFVFGLLLNHTLVHRLQLIEAFFLLRSPAFSHKSFDDILSTSLSNSYTVPCRRIHF